MRTLLRSYLINVVIIYVSSLLIPGLTFSRDLKTLLWAALAFGLVNMFVKPFIKVILLPVNILTLGLFSWLINVILLFITTVVVSEFKVSAFDFPGLDFYGASLPAMHISTLASYILSSFMISFLNRVLYWLIKD